MSRRPYEKISAWLEECHALVRRDLDNVILLTGAEGSGKSNFGYQIARALDPTFGLPRVTFEVDRFVDVARSTNKYGAVFADELLVNKRKGMWGGTIELLDFLQVCRGLNLHLLIAFPHETQIDRAIIDTRVRWWIHIERRGLAVLRIPYIVWDDAGVPVKHWSVAARWSFKKNAGPAWRAYIAAKDANMKRRFASEAEVEDPSQVVVSDDLLAATRRIFGQ